MDKVIPIFYSEYGRYISRFRMIPYEVDCLTPVYRRLLLSLHDMASKKLTKSAKITGYASGTYHPHGPAAIYGAMQTLYKQGFLDVQGNFGSPGMDDASASGERYTEAKLKNWINEFCFKYIDLVPWDNYEYENEPLFLPSPLPMGLIGEGDIYSGIAFHKCTIPRYKITDLAKRLKYLITDEEKIIIYPTFERDGCNCKKDDEAAENILTKGVGTLVIVPKGKLVDNKLHVYGRTPQTNYNSIKDDDRISWKCISGKTIDIILTPTKRGEDTNTFVNYVYKKHLIKNINFNICVCSETENGKTIVTVKGVDDILLSCYEKYVECSKYRFINDCVVQIQKKFENEIIIQVRKILEENPKVKSIDEIIQIFAAKNITLNKEEYEDDNWVTKSILIDKDQVKEICTSRNIKALIEHTINIQDNDTKISQLKKNIVDNVNICYDVICNLAISGKI